MKHSFKQILKPRAYLLLLTITCLIMQFTGCKKGNHQPVFEISTVASGLAHPMGIETDHRGNIWVAIPGTAHDDGKIVLIKPNGNKYDAIVNLSSKIHEASGELEGPAHLIMENGKLYILAANYLYLANVSHFRPGQTPIDASTLHKEDIAAFVVNYPFKNNYHDSHPYNLIKGPYGDLYIADAGANAIIHRNSAGNYSVLAEVPGIPNPTPVGPPMVESVPTGIVFDGHNFLVTTLLGFPFPAGHALIYKISKTGEVSVYQNGFNSLTDIAMGRWNGNLVLQFATFNMGFMPNTGALLSVDGNHTNELAGSLNMPVGITQADNHTWYITEMGNGTVLKATYSYR